MSKAESQLKSAISPTVTTGVICRKEPLYNLSPVAQRSQRQEYLKHVNRYQTLSTSERIIHTSYRKRSIKRKPRPIYLSKRKISEKNLEESHLFPKELSENFVPPTEIPNYPRSRPGFNYHLVPNKTARVSSFVKQKPLIKHLVKESINYDHINIRNITRSLYPSTRSADTRSFNRKKISFWDEGFRRLKNRMIRIKKIRQATEL